MHVSAQHVSANLWLQSVNANLWPQKGGCVTVSHHANIQILPCI